MPALRPHARALAALALILTSACAAPAPSDGAARLTFIGEGLCLAPRPDAAPPGRQIWDVRAPPLSLLTRAGYLACVAHLSGGIGDAALAAAIADGPPTLLRMEADRALYSLGERPDRTWIARSPHLKAACAGLPALERPPPDAALFCRAHFAG